MRQVVQREEGGRDYGRIARPVVDDPRADFDAAGHRREGRHGHDSIANQPALRLPNRLEAGVFGIFDIFNRFRQRMGILQIKRYAI